MSKAHLPESRRGGFLPNTVSEAIREAESERQRREQARSWPAQGQLIPEKGATPGPRATEPADCLEDLRPKAITVDRSVAACTSPDVLRAGALEQYGDLHARTGHGMINQWETKYTPRRCPS